MKMASDAADDSGRPGLIHSYEVFLNLSLVEFVLDFWKHKMFLPLRTN